MNTREIFIICLSIVTISFLVTRCEERGIDHDAGSTYLTQKQFEKMWNNSHPSPTPAATARPMITPNENIIPPQ